MKNKKFSILLMVLGVVLLLVGVVLMIIGADEKESKTDNNDTNNVVNSNEDKCKYVYSKDDNFSFEFKCDSVKIESDNLLFKFDKNEEGTYSLDILYNDQSIFNSKNNNMIMYTEEQAGNTIITNINDLYFVHSYAAGQCGDMGHLIVISSSGELLKTFSGIFKIDKNNNNIYVNEITNEECGNVLGKEELYDLYKVVESKLVKVSSGYEFKEDTVVNDGNLSFVYGNENDNLYLNISYNGNNIFSSKTNGIMIYGDEHAGHTNIHKIDDIYLVDTAAAHQCGLKGSLIVINSNGNLIGTFDSLNLKIDYDNKKVTFIEDKNNECTNVEGSNLIEVTYQINGNMFSK